MTIINEPASISFRLWGRQALFTDPISKLGGEKCTYLLPTYEAIKGVLKSIYWKPTFIWVVDKVRVLRPICTQSKSIKLIHWHKSGSDLAFYTYLHDVEYEVQAHFEWNMHQDDFTLDRIHGKHLSIAERNLKKGGNKDIFLGTRECQAYIEPCEFGSSDCFYDRVDEQTFPLQFHSFAYPDETGVNELHSRFFYPLMRNGIIEFPHPLKFNNQNPSLLTRFVREMHPKRFKSKKSLLSMEIGVGN